MKQSKPRRRTKQLSKSSTKNWLRDALHAVHGWIRRFWQKSWWRKVLLIVLAILLLDLGGMYAIAEWYIWQNRHKPLEVGATFIPDYARSLGLDPKETFQAVISDLSVKHLRLVSYWSSIEKSPGMYDFSDLDWQFQMAEQKGVKVSLAIGLRQPRWPECHMPDWAEIEAESQWYAQLNTFITKVIERYRTSPALESYQLENEFFLTVFGECKNFDRARLIAESSLVRQTDPSHMLIISRSNNAIGWPIGEPVPDKFGVSVYKRVWDKTVTKRYFEYPLPAWFYATLAGIGKIWTGKDLMIHELQTEAWTPDGFDIQTAPIAELYKSLSPERLTNRIRYGEATGMKRMDLWGVEWWYQMKTKRGAPELWDTAKAEIQRINLENAQR